MRSLHTNARPRDDVAVFVNELLSIFALSDTERDRFSRRIRNGLRRVYDELAPQHKDDG